MKNNLGASVLASLIFAVSSTEAADVLNQSFNTSTTVSSYVASPAGLGQFNNISAEADGGTWSINADNQLQIVRKGSSLSTSGAGITRFTDFTGAPTVLTVKFDFGMVANIFQNDAVSIDILGNTSSVQDYNGASPGNNVFSTLYVDASGSSGFKFERGGVSSPAYSADGTMYSITYLLNKSGTTKGYVGPNGLSKTLSNNCMSLWVGSSIVFDSLPVSNGSMSGLTDLRIRFSKPDNGTYKFDNFVVQDTLPASLRKTGVLGLDDYPTHLWHYIGGKPNITMYPKLINGVADDGITFSYTRVANDTEFFMPFPKEMDFKLEKLEYFDGTGQLPVWAPTKFYFLKRDPTKPGGVDWNRIPGPVYDGKNYLVWKTFTPAAPIDLYAIIIAGKSSPPGELKITGSWIPYTRVPYVNKQPKIAAQIGTNSYAWNILQASNRGLNPTKTELFKAFERTRDYFDWAKLEPNKGEYTFAPTPNGSWNYDLMYQWFKDNNIAVHVCIKGHNSWSLSFFGYPPGTTSEAAVAPWTTMPAPVKPTAPPSNATQAEKDAYTSQMVAYEQALADRDADITRLRTLPESWRAFSEGAFQIVARYGSNPNVNPALVKPFSNPTLNTSKDWYAQDRIPKPGITNPRVGVRADWVTDSNNQYVQNKKIGLGMIRSIECDNEVDATWKGRERYLLPKEHAMMLSVFYDGHKNTMGPGIGVKNADPNIIVTTSGIADSKPGYFIQCIEEWKRIRGYKVNAQGQTVVDIPVDVLNFHTYSNVGGGQYDGGASGLPPEMSNVRNITPDSLQALKEFGCDLPAWVTETGFGMNAGSQQALATPARTKEQSHGDWIIRTILFNNRVGISETYFYQSYDESSYMYAIANGNTDNGVYSAMGLLEEKKTLVAPDTYTASFRRRFAADYMEQLSVFNDYRFKQTIATDPVVDKYDRNGAAMYSLFIPDVVGRSASYTLDLGTATSATLHRMVDGAETFSTQALTPAGGKVTLTVTESPIFVTTP